MPLRWTSSTSRRSPPRFLLWQCPNNGCRMFILSITALPKEMLEVKTQHDVIRESIEEKIKSTVSEGAMPSFQYREAQGIPSMPRLSGMEVRVSRCANPCQAPFQNAETDNLRHEMGEIRRSRMSEEDQAAFYGMLVDIRSEVIMLLDCLIQYDDLISTDGANFLHKAMLSIREVDGGK